MAETHAGICRCLRPLGKFNTTTGWYCSGCGGRIAVQVLKGPDLVWARALTKRVREANIKAQKAAEK